jgi:bacterioferritin-associated ferredoxin
MIICHCAMVNDKMIRSAAQEQIEKEGDCTLEQLISLTGACSGCRCCEGVVEDILDEIKIK